MALVSDRQMIYQRQLDAIIQDKVNGDDVDMSDPSVLPEVDRLRGLIINEVEKKKLYKVENIRRKHNYLPLIVQLLKVLGAQGKLLPIYEKAKVRAQERHSLAANKK